MPTVITITAGNIVLRGELSDTETASAVSDALPIEASFHTWGDEFYFEIPVDRSLDATATTEVKVGDIGYWPPGKALALFFGPTPMSTGPDPVPASEVNIVGRIHDDARRLLEAKSARKIVIERLHP